MKIVKKLFITLDKFLAAIVVFLFSALVLTITLQVTFRFLAISSSWTTELAIFLFIWLVFIGGFFTIRKGLNITFDIVIDLATGSAWKLLFTFVNVVSVGFLLFIVVEGFQIAFSLRGNSPVLQIPMTYGYLAVPVGGIVMLIAQVERYLVLLNKTQIRDGD